MGLKELSFVTISGLKSSWMWGDRRAIEFSLPELKLRNTSTCRMNGRSERNEAEKIRKERKAQKVGRREGDEGRYSLVALPGAVEERERSGHGGCIKLSAPYISTMHPPL